MDDRIGEQKRRREVARTEVPHAHEGGQLADRHDQPVKRAQMRPMTGRQRQHGDEQRVDRRDPAQR